MRVKPAEKFCFGCEPLGGKDWGEFALQDVERAVVRSVELGVSFFDTAAVYGLGLSEERLGKTLGSRRHDVVIATKGGLSWSTKSTSANGRARVFRDSSAKAIRNGVEASLRRLRLECLPLYYIHWPDLATKFKETFDTLMELKSEGKISSIGCSNFTVQQLMECRCYADIDYVQVPVNLMDSNMSDQMLRFCEQNGVGVIAYNVLAQGLLTGKYSKDARFLSSDRRSRLPEFSGELFLETMDRVELLKSQARKHNLDLTTYAIRWALSRPGVTSVITGIKNVVQLETNLKAINEDC